MMMPIVEIENLLSAVSVPEGGTTWDSHARHGNGEENTDVALPESVHHLVSSALSHVRQAQQQMCERDLRIRYLESHSTTDEATGLWNKRGFVLMAQKMFSFARYYDETGLVALVEIEKRAIQDAEISGIDIHERLVRQVGSLLLSRFPDPCVVARVDPYIFGIVLPTSNIEDSQMMLADEIKQAVKDGALSQNTHIPLRINVGIAPYHSMSVLEDVLEDAEGRMEQNRQYHLQSEHLTSLEEALQQRLGNVVLPDIPETFDDSYFSKQRFC